MFKKDTSLIIKIIFSIFIYIIIHSFFIGISTQPMEGDSLYYHIPIAESILNGDFLSPDYGNVFHKYFPGATESILAIFILLKVPLNLFNVAGLVALFISCYFLARKSNNNKEYSILFATCICTLQVVVRWVHAQTIDIWLGAYFVTSLALLQKPKKSYLYFLVLGMVFGMLIGSKYSGPLFFISLIIVYRKNFLKYLNFHKFLFFNLGIWAFGIFWYIRNWMAKSNPFYPLDTFIFQGLTGNEIIATPVWKTIIAYPSNLLNAFFGEYMIWSIIIPIMLFLLIYKIIKKETILDQILKLITVGFINLLIFFSLPSGNSYQLHVSQFRFSYPVFIPLILCIFILAKKYKQTKLIVLLVFSNIIIISSMSYNPKLIVVWLPIIFFLLNKKHYMFLKNSFYKLLTDISSFTKT